MGFFSKLFGICGTQPPSDSGCWSYDDGKLKVDLSRASELAAPGGAIRLEGGSLPQRVLVIHGDDGKFHAFPNRCTHIGHRRLDPVPGTGKLRCCSIGQSEFDFEGHRLAGSARDDIRPYEVTVEGETLVVAVS